MRVLQSRFLRVRGVEARLRKSRANWEEVELELCRPLFAELGWEGKERDNWRELGVQERLFCFVFYFFFLFFLGRPVAYEVPRPGTRSELQFQSKPKLWQHWILNLLCWARGRTCVPALPRHHCFRCTTTGRLSSILFSKIKIRKKRG